MIKNLIAKWRQRKLVAQNQPLLGVVPAAADKCCGGDCACSSEKPKATKPKATVEVTKKPAAKSAAKPKGKK